MVKVIYRDRLGNRLFQYCFGRILAEELGWRLECAPIAGFPRTLERVDGQAFDRPEVAYRGQAVVDLPGALADRTPRRIVVDAWVQRYDYFRPYAARIRRWLMPPNALPQVGSNDLVLHLRLGSDYERKRWTLHPDFYDRVLQTAGAVDQLYICYDATETVSPQVRALYPRLPC